jgi:hypothetical protein
LLAEKRVCPARVVNRGVVRESKVEVRVDDGEVEVEEDSRVEEVDVPAGDGEGVGDIEDIGVVKKTRLRAKR